MLEVEGARAPVPHGNATDPDCIPDEFQNSVWTAYFQGTFCGKISVKIRAVVSEIWAKLLKNVLSRNVEESFRKFLYPDHEADEFQNVISSFSFTDTSVVKFSWRSGQ